MQKIQISNREIALVCFAGVLLAGYMLFKGTGMGVLFAMALFFVLSPYAILRNFALDEDERWFFALFIGLGLFSTFVWGIGQVISLKLALISGLIIVAIVSFVLHKFVKKPSAA